MYKKTALFLTFGSILAALFIYSCETASPAQQAENSPKDFSIVYGVPVLDGSAADEAWDNAEWHDLNQLWAGTMPDSNDFKGQYKLLWDENNLYILAEITDDSLTDIHVDGLDKYWDDDCLEVFIDEDASGGNHQYNYNAFAYHIALDGRVVDIAPDSSFQYYDDHCVCRRTTIGNTSVWEVAVKIFDGNTYKDGGENIPRSLSLSKKMGFALAYCDNDRSLEREHFMGNVPVEGEDKNQGWINAGIFGSLTLK